MKPPENAEIIEWATSTSWFDEWGIFCSISKRVPQQSLEETKKALAEFVKLLNGRKICMLIDVTNTSESSKETRDFAAAEFPKHIKAIAMLSSSPLGKMLANLFFNLKTQPYPTKMFNDEESAREWLKQYL